MNVILLIDDKPLWKTDAGGVSLVQRHIDAISNCSGVQRVAISAHPGMSENQHFYRVPLYKLPTNIRSWIRYSSASPEDQVYDIMREMCWDSALVTGSFSPYLFSFMLDEIFSGLENTEYGLRQITWKEAVDKKPVQLMAQRSSSLSVNPDDIYYAYSEVIKGAAWQEVMEEIDGK